jgi:hypothetical protein
MFGTGILKLKSYSIRIDLKKPADNPAGFFVYGHFEIPFFVYSFSASNKTN